MKKNNINRREFLKMAGLLPFGYYASKISTRARTMVNNTRKNIIVIVFDAFSAHHISLYGYARNTTPNIDALASRAVVYHNHYSGSNFTSPGVATLLTGALPWTNRAMVRNGEVAKGFVNRSLFSIFDGYYKVAYSHNEWANTLLRQFRFDINDWLPRGDLYLPSSHLDVQKFFRFDPDASSVSWVRNIRLQDDGFANSLFLSMIFSYLETKQAEKYAQRFPLGLPTGRADNGYLLEDAIDWVAHRVTVDEGAPFFGYFHFLTPHGPYNPPSEYLRMFLDDGINFLDKPKDVLAREFIDTPDALVLRSLYDAFVRYADREFGRLFELLENSGVLEDTWLILTSDHGETFERNAIGHMTRSLYEPLIRIPLLIFEPGSSRRKDIYDATSALDIMPTLAYLSGKPMPDWAEGQVLPPYGNISGERTILAVRSHFTKPDEPLHEGSIVLKKGKYKLHYYFGYPEFDTQEALKLFDVETDPDELNDLTHAEPRIASDLLKELKSKLDNVNAPYI